MRIGQVATWVAAGAAGLAAIAGGVALFGKEFVQGTSAVAPGTTAAACLNVNLPQRLEIGAQVRTGPPLTMFVYRNDAGARAEPPDAAHAEQAALPGGYRAAARAAKIIVQAERNRDYCLAMINDGETTAQVDHVMRGYLAGW